MELPDLMRLLTDTAMVPVNSSNAAAVGYDAPSQTLFVQFQGGGTYAYHDVSAEKHAALLAGSVGRLLHTTIKPFHAFTRIV